MSNPVAAIDLGHSAVKMTFDARSCATQIGGVERVLFPSLAAPAIQIRNEAEARMAALETVLVNGRPYFVGQTAELQGKAALATGLNADWIQSPEHAALLTMTKRVLDERGAEGDRIYVLGLPVAQFDSSRDKLRKLAISVFGEQAQIKVMPQPMGAYQAHMLARSGMPRPERSMGSESWAVIDVGYYSTDFVLIKEGRWIEAASGGCAGVRMAAEFLQRHLESQGMERDLVDAEHALRTGAIRHFGKHKEIDAGVRKDAAGVVATKVADMASQLMAPYVHSLDGVLVTGGGAAMVLPTLQAVWPHAQHVVDEHHNVAMRGSRFIVSEGYYRYGRSLNLLRQLHRAA